MSLPVSNSKSLAITVGKDAIVKTFLAKGTITAGHLVRYDTSQTGEDASRCVVEVTTALSTCGVALESATTGLPVRCLVEGYCTGILTDGNITAGIAVVSGTNGALEVYDGTEAFGPCGVALAADSSTTSGGVLFVANA